MSTATHKRIGILLFNGFNLMDVSGPLEAFSHASRISNTHYEPILIGHHQHDYMSESGIALSARCDLVQHPPLDILIVPGGSGARDPRNRSVFNAWLTAQLQQCQKLLSICTGAYLVAGTGAFDYQPVTTHWQFAHDFQLCFPKTRLQRDKLFVQSGKLYSSAGVTAGIDLALSIIEQDVGAELTMQIAKFLVIPYRRAGSQTQFSEALKYQTLVGSEFADLIAWMRQNIATAMGVSDLARQAGMSERNFSRRFNEAFSVSPAKYLASLRIEVAKTYLAERHCHISQVADACGYPNVDVFRRAFERHVAMTPSAYRKQFSLTIDQD